MEEKIERSEWRWVLGWGIAIIALSSIPYLWGWWLTPHGAQFTGLTHNIDDGAVYLSWMRQAADGHFFIRNLFTAESQPARAFNILFLLMGGVTRLLHIPLIWAFHLFRAGLGIALIFVVWKFSRLFLDKRARMLLIPVIGLTSGVGWLIPGATAPNGSVDVWQPEAITFLSIYLNPLFIAGLVLMIGAFYWLELARRTGRSRYAVCAGLSMLALGNVHTYDVITVACVWTAYVVVLAFSDRKAFGKTIRLSAIAGLVAAPSVAYQAYILSIDPVFRARANTVITSPPIWSFLTGYGCILLGAAAGAWLYTRAAWRGPFPQPSTFNSQLLLISWSVVGFVVPYIPVAQQRKLIMGVQIPIAILCAYTLAWLLTRLPRTVGWGVVATVFLLSVGSNARFLAQDMRLLGDDRTVTHYRPYLLDSEVDAMRFLRRTAAPSDVILAPPDIALFTPAFAGRRVYYGHWSETPGYGAKLREYMDFAESCAAGEPDTSLIEHSRANRLVQYSDDADCLSRLSFLREELVEDDVVVYNIPRAR